MNDTDDWESVEGAPIPGTTFDFDAVDSDLRGRELPDKCESTCPIAKRLAEEKALHCLREIAAWIVPLPIDDTDGILCRAVLWAWAVRPELHGNYTQAEMARRIGKKKQSLNRFVAGFEAAFPRVLKQNNNNNEQQQTRSNPRTKRGGRAHKRARGNHTKKAR